MIAAARNEVVVARAGREVTSVAGKARQLAVYEPATYVIRVGGVLDASWSEQLGGLQITTLMAGGYRVTELAGRLADQAALHGVLALLYELGLPLLSVAYVSEL
jgi:hypothetical protein